MQISRFTVASPSLHRSVRRSGGRRTEGHVGDEKPESSDELEHQRDEGEKLGIERPKLKGREWDKRS